MSDPGKHGQATNATGQQLSAVAALFGTDGPPDFDDHTGPSHWADLTADEAKAAWPELRSWVEHLVTRFPHLDHHVIPACWWRHNGHVEALSALRDHERISYAATAPASAALEWHRALRDIEAMLREWTGEHGCGATHNDRDRRLRPPTPLEWAKFVQADVEDRERTAIDGAFDAEEPSP